MTKNMGMIDRALRLTLAALILFLALATPTLGGGVLLWIGLGVAGVLAVTSLIGMCPLYRVIGLKTCKD